MKWIVQLDYEFGEIEPNSIYFRRVCSDDMEYGSAYDTKREALEAFCQGQYAINQLRKKMEAEQKKEDGWDKAIKEAKEKYGYGKPEERIDVIRDFSPKEEAEQKKEEQKENVIAYPKALRLNLEVEKAIEDKLFERFEERLKEKFGKIENRLTEIEGVLTSIGSPDYDLRKKVDGLEKKHRRLLKDYKTHLFASHNYTMTPKDIELIRQYEPEE